MVWWWPGLAEEDGESVLRGDSVSVSRDESLGNGLHNVHFTAMGKKRKAPLTSTPWGAL